MEKLGQQIRLARVRLKMRQRTLAAIIGMRQSSLSRIENEFRNPELETAFKIADALGVTLDELRRGGA